MTCCEMVSSDRRGAAPLGSHLSSTMDLRRAAARRAWRTGSGTKTARGCRLPGSADLQGQTKEH